jgi:hypothetical protein
MNSEKYIGLDVHQATPITQMAQWVSLNLQDPH